MNTYFEQNHSFDSNKRIIEAYFGEAVKPAGAWSRRLETLLGLLAALLHILSSATLRRICKTAGVALSLVGMVGVIGAMERGSLGLGAGLVLGALLVGIEFLCLCPKKKN